MKQLTFEKGSMTAHAGMTNRQRERLFYTGMAVAFAIIVFAGFSRTYYLRPYFTGATPLMPLLHLHGIVFTSWLLLYLTQTFLVAAHRINVHRRLGIGGAVIAVLMILVGSTTAIIRAGQGAAPPGIPALAFLTIPLGDMVVFSCLVGAGFYFRRRPDVHKRLMLLATISILDAAIARLPFAFLRAGPVAFFGLEDILIVVCLLYDFIARGRIHRVTAWGGLLIIASQPLRLMIGGTHAWLAFADWLTHWAA